jgi:actin-related protein
MDDLCMADIDLGSHSVKAGWVQGNGEELRSIFRNEIGIPKNWLLAANQYYIGDEMSCKYPLEYHAIVQHREIKNWGYVEAMLHHTICNELRLEPDSIVLISPDDSYKEQLETMWRDASCSVFR